MTTIIIVALLLVATCVVAGVVNVLDDSPAGGE